MVECADLLKYRSDDIREVLKVTIKNHNRYATCRNKLRLAIDYIKLTNDT